GWASYADTLKKIFAGHLEGYEPDCYPNAREIIPLALQAFHRGELKTPEEAAPVYLRNKVTN
ncbi:MAG: tRNA (adenosine(37)-N6)-threonylcarbamoyltransferase complex dimerization subunit type 1 TsaB, partial [Gammaproteobacteria bacterium]